MISNSEWKAQKTDVFFEEENIRGKQVVLVGDAGGVSQTLGVLLAKRGARVFLAARSAEELERVLAEIARAGGEGDGEVVDLSQPEVCRWFFERAARRLGRIDALINTLGGEECAQTGSLGCQNACMQEAIQWMQTGADRHIVNVNLSSANQPGGMEAQRISAALRRQASELGIRVTTIEPGGDMTHGGEKMPGTEEIARTVMNSLAQPFRVDMVLLQGQVL